ncbi:hypothetical protein ACM1PE_19300 [Achromobacter sp. PD1]|uniref:hypothetical protein n=1 Tax=Achromobacter sp. PD1 TaxID=3399125 RepID=UPI003AF4D569
MAQLRNGKTSLHALDGFNDPAIRKSRLLHAVELLNEKILLLTSSLLRGDYQVTSDSWDELARSYTALTLQYAECAARHRATVDAWSR